MAEARDMAESDVTESAVPDVLAPGLRVVFCGINPGRVSAAAAAHFANPRNDFWRLLHAARFTSRLYEPHEQFELLREGVGVTNAAARTTPGSGDLRRADFAGSADRLERLARDLKPGWIGLVGKEAYRGAFGERPGLGLQERTLGDTRLFVLPSTSPANAAVPWGERLRWFQELAGRSSGRPLRQGVRAVVLAEEGRTLLTRFDFLHGPVWAPPGGGVEPGETLEPALRRELWEECGLRDVELGPLLWTRTHWFADMRNWGGQTESYFLVRTPQFEPAPELDPAAEDIAEYRWFAPDELDAVVTSPRRLGPLVRELLADGPREPFDAGV
ncbi:MAG TPA: NUDIX domain-containing protein [Gaiellaceae bacterium]|nr:NUDIX domain-containing protein [Gaiellaceae bacterium]